MARFSDVAGLGERAREAVEDQSSKTVPVLSSLLAVQDVLGYLPPEALDEVALRTGATANDVWGVASLYPNFRFTPPTQHLVEVCWGPSCHLLGAQSILQGVLAHLGIEGEGDTEDKVFTLKLNTCLGACPHGPMMSFDHELVGNMSLPRAVTSIEALRSAPGAYQGAPSSSQAEGETS